MFHECSCTLIQSLNCKCILFCKKTLFFTVYFPTIIIINQARLKIFVDNHLFFLFFFVFIFIFWLSPQFLAFALDSHLCHLLGVYQYQWLSKHGEGLLQTRPTHLHITIKFFFLLFSFESVCRYICPEYSIGNSRGLSY